MKSVKRARGGEMTPNKYSEKFKDPRWQKKRLEILERDNWECVMCGEKNKTLNVHHKIYFQGQEPWEYGNSLLVTLCDDCHEYEHSVTKEFQEVLMAEIYGSGLLGTDMLDLAFFISKMDRKTLYSMALVPESRISRMLRDAKVTP